jgi:phosphoglycolate phosphatase
MPANLKTGWTKSAGHDQKAYPGKSISQDLAVPDSDSQSMCRVHCAPGFDWRSAEAYLFDIDGTILRSHDSVHFDAFHYAVREVFGLELDVSGVPVHGNTDIGILRGFLDKVGVAEQEWLPKIPHLVEVMCTQVEQNASALRPVPCPGVQELIQILHSEGKLLILASGNLGRIGWAKLEACRLKEFFSFGTFSDRNEKREDIFAFGLAEALRRNPHARVCVVGDTPADILAARANKIPVIAVATGIYEVEELLPYAPEMCISSCADLLLLP